MIQNKQHNQVMITDTKHYINLQDMLLAVVTYSDIEYQSFLLH